MAKGTLRNPGKVMRRALKFAATEGNERLERVHLDECGDVVACDSYRLYVEHGAWDGPSVDLTPTRAKELSKLKASVKSVEVEGEELGYTKYKALLEGLECKALAHVNVGQACAIAKRHGTVKLDFNRGDLVISGHSEEPEPAVKFEKACEGEGMLVALNSKYLESALKVCGKFARVEVTAPTKPVVARPEDASERFMVIVASVALGKTPEPRVKGFNRAPKAPEPKADGKPIDLKGERVCITGTLPGMTRGEAFTRLKLAGAEPCERFTSKVTLFVIAADAGRSKREKADAAIARGQRVRVVNGTEFVRALNEQGKTASERKQESMAKSEAKQADGFGGWVVYGDTGAGGTAWLSFSKLKTNKGACNWLQRVAREADGTELAAVHAEFVGSLGEREKRMSEVKSMLKGAYAKVVTWTPTTGKSGLASTWEAKPKPVAAPPKAAKPNDAKPKVKAPEPPKPGKVYATEGHDGKPAVIAETFHGSIESKEDTLEKGYEERIAALEAELKARNAELEAVWKENEHLKAKPEGSASPEPKDAPKVQEAAAAVSLDALKAWCGERGLVASQKREGCCIWVEGESKPYADELKEMGFRFAKKRKSWYLNPAA